jgi:hypothetical protein
MKLIVAMYHVEACSSKLTEVPTRPADLEWFSLVCCYECRWGVYSIGLSVISATTRHLSNHLSPRHSREVDRDEREIIRSRHSCLIDAVG